MTSERAVTTVETLSREQVELIKHTVAVGATDMELKLFLYQAGKRGLDPLSRQVHFIKRKRYNPDTERYEEVGTIQTGIDGFRVIANRTGKLSGIKRGTILDGGILVGAWAEVYRSDWQHPAREEVSFKEYCQHKKDGSPMGLWATMPETMLKKVAEASALRMAFPEDLSGIYSHEEMQQADSEQRVVLIPSKVETSPVKEESGVVVPEEAVKSVEKQPEATSPIDMEGLKGSLKQAKWTEGTCISWLKSKVNYQGLDISGKFVDIIKRMNKEQADFLVKEIQSRIEVA